MINIVDNAIKFTNSGSISIDIQIQPGFQTYDIDQVPLAVVTIKDTGIGIEMLDGSTTRGYKGCGLGLAISHSLMELMGGHISLESAGKNQGTTVAISLPISLKNPA